MIQLHDSTNRGFYVGRGYGYLGGSGSGFNHGSGTLFQLGVQFGQFPDYPFYAVICTRFKVQNFSIGALA